MSGTVNVGSGETFTSLTNAGGLFDQINAGELTGNLTVNITSDLTAETGSIALNAWVNNGGTYTVTIHPVGNRIVSGITVNGGNGSVIPINGATGLTIDGLNDGSNSLTFTQTGLYYVGSVIDLKGASGNTITNVSINNWNNNSAISITNSTLPSSNNTISNCIISSDGIDVNRGQGIKLTGSSSLGSNNVIKNNTVTNFTYYHILLDGKFTNTEIFGNDIYNTVGTTWANAAYAAIYIATASGGGTTEVFNNKIHDILTQNNSTGAFPAIYAYGQSGTTTNIYNNEITLDVAFNPLAGRTGIRTAGYGNVNIYHNSIYIGGADISAGDSYGIYKLGYGTVDIKNNVIYNARSNGTTGSAGKHYGIYVYASYTNPPTSDYNDIYVDGVGGVVGFSTSDKLTLADWQTATSQDANSLSEDPLFTSTANLLPTNAALNIGTPVAGITEDIMGLTRNILTPTLGAYEIVHALPTFTITGNAGIAGAVLSWTDDTAKTITADGSGAYSFTVSYNWSGVVTPSLAGYAFTPANKVYTNILADVTDENYAASQLPASVVGYWNLNETAGNSFSDLTGVNNGTGNVSPTPSAGQVSGAQLFDGSTTKIEVPANPSLDFLAADNFSVEFWYKGNYCSFF